MKDPYESTCNEFEKAWEKARKHQKIRERRRLTVKWIGGIIGFVTVNISFIILIDLTDFFDLIYTKVDLPYFISDCFLTIFYILYCLFLFIFLAWILEKSKIYFLIIDWIEGNIWEKHGNINIVNVKKFPRKERRTLIKNLISRLEVISEKLDYLHEEGSDTENNRLVDSVETINRLIQKVIPEVDYFSSSFRLLLYCDHVSWTDFVLELDEVAKNLDLEMQKISEHERKVRPLIKDAYQSIEQVLKKIIHISK